MEMYVDVSVCVVFTGIIDQSACRKIFDAFHSPMAEKNDLGKSKKLNRLYHAFLA